MLKEGDLVKWCEPLDADYSYGTISELNGKFAVVRGSGYHAGSVASVHISYIQKIQKGGNSYGGSEEYSE